MSFFIWGTVGLCFGNLSLTYTMRLFQEFYLRLLLKFPKTSRFLSCNHTQEFPAYLNRSQYMQMVLHSGGRGVWHWNIINSNIWSILFWPDESQDKVSISQLFKTRNVNSIDIFTKYSDTTWSHAKYLWAQTSPILILCRIICMLCMLCSLTYLFSKPLEVHCVGKDDRKRESIEKSLFVTSCVVEEDINFRSRLLLTERLDPTNGVIFSTNWFPAPNAKQAAHEASRLCCGNKVMSVWDKSLSDKTLLGEYRHVMWNWNYLWLISPKECNFRFTKRSL